MAQISPYTLLSTHLTSPLETLPPIMHPTTQNDYLALSLLTRLFPPNESISMINTWNKLGENANAMRTLQYIQDDQDVAEQTQWWNSKSSSMRRMGVLLQKNINEDKLRQIIAQDASAMVRLNAVARLREQDVQIDSVTARAMLQQLPDHSQWGQIILLDTLKRYRPQQGEEMFDYLDGLDDMLMSPSSSVVVAACHLFLHYTVGTDLQAEVCNRIKDPLITASYTSDYKLKTFLLNFISQIISLSKAVWSDTYTHFMLDDADPDYLQIVKLKLITLTCTDDTAEDALTVLSGYLENKLIPDSLVESMEQVMLKSPRTQAICTRLLLSALDTCDDLTAETIGSVVYGTLQKDESFKPDLISCGRSLLSKLHVTSILSLVLLYMDDDEELPYAFEDQIQLLPTRSWCSRQALYYGSLMLFCRRPGEMQSVFMKVLQIWQRDNDTHLATVGNQVARLLESADDACVEALIKCFSRP